MMMNNDGPTELANKTTELKDKLAGLFKESWNKCFDDKMDKQLKLVMHSLALSSFLSQIAFSIMRGVPLNIQKEYIDKICEAAKEHLEEAIEEMNKEKQDE